MLHLPFVRQKVLLKKINNVVLLKIIINFSFSKFFFVFCFLFKFAKRVY